MHQSPIKHFPEATAIVVASIASESRFPVLGLNMARNTILLRVPILRGGVVRAKVPNGASTNLALLTTVSVFTNKLTNLRVVWF